MITKIWVKQSPKEQAKHTRMLAKCTLETGKTIASMLVTNKKLGWLISCLTLVWITLPSLGAFIRCGVEALKHLTHLCQHLHMVSIDLLFQLAH